MEDEGAWTFPQSEVADGMLADYYRIRGWGELPALASGGAPVAG